MKTTINLEKIKYLHENGELTKEETIMILQKETTTGIISDEKARQLGIYAGTSRTRTDYEPNQGFKPGQSINSFVKTLLGNKNIDGERKKWLHSFDQCVLPQDVKDSVEEALVVMLNSKKFDDWGITEHFEKGLTNAILLYGPPGTGKTMTCESIAAILDKNLMKVDSGSIQSSIPGQTERNVKDSFAKAKKENAVIMFDECDSMLGDRNNVGQIMASEINSLLTEIERFDGVVVLTTNRLHSLDPALQRRIISKVKLDKPDYEARVQIWKNLIPPKMPTENVDVEILAEIPLTGGEIKNSILIASRKAIAKNKDCVTQEMFYEAANSVWQATKDYEKTRPKRYKGNQEGMDLRSGKEKDGNIGVKKDIFGKKTKTEDDDSVKERKASVVVGSAKKMVETPEVDE